MFIHFGVILVSLCIVQSAKILVVVPTPAISHQLVFRPLIQELINHDHEIIHITTDPIYPKGKSPNNLKEIDIHDVSYTLWDKMISNWAKNNRRNKLSTMTTVYHIFTEIFEEQLKDKSVQSLITNKTIKFDLLILEACIAPVLIFTHIFKAPTIINSSLGPKTGFTEMIGAATHPFIYPTHFHQRLYNLTIWEKIREMYYHVMFEQMVKTQELNNDIMLQRLFGVDTPTTSELKNNVHMLFLNIHPIWIHNQPVPTNVVFTWGIHKKIEQLLPEDLQSYLDSSKKGVIYVSFGTTIKFSMISPKTLKILLEVFSQLPYNVLWKWDTNELPGKSENIRIFKWLPQYDVLRHPNVKLFITQGGLQSTEEAIHAGVPLIGIPLFADQEYNTEKYVHFKIGIKLNFQSLTVQKFETAVKTILSDESYRRNIARLRTQMYDQSKPALENAIWWVEYVLRHGGAKHLRTPAANISWTEYYELELLFVILGGLTVFLTVLLLALYSCLKCLSSIINETNKRKVS